MGSSAWGEEGGEELRYRGNLAGDKGCFWMQVVKLLVMS